ncbi:MAG: hypothetical protein JSV81_04375 [Anaerolineales bacterium]|nr:MAG: hypothetical protein JSV81_04375 [Anaerolineales bacterium]
MSDRREPRNLTSGPNTLRRSAAPEDTTSVNNYPGQFPTEDWIARYWNVTFQGDLEQRQVTLQLPHGFGAPCVPVRVGQNGCVRSVRRWGFGCYPEILNDIDFDITPLLSNPHDDAEWLTHYFGVVTFDLPGYFVIASPTHPFLLYDSHGVLKGSYTQWRTHLGALSYIVGNLDASFVGLQVENSALYQQALGYLLQAVEESHPGEATVG